MATGNGRTTVLLHEVDDWLEQLKFLLNNVKDWAEAAGWCTRLSCSDVKEKDGVRYEVPVLVLVRDETEISLVPVARKVSGAEGVVDFYSMPDFDVVASLYRQKGQWLFHYAFHSDAKESPSAIETKQFLLNEESLNRVLNDMVAHA